MSHSKFPWTTHPHTPTAVFDGDGRRIIDQWVAPDFRLGEVVEMVERAPYFHEWKGVKMTIVCLRMDPNGNHWVSVVEGEQRHRGNGVYDGETTDIDASHLVRVNPATPLDPETAAANAVMIAAIPEMLAALDSSQSLLAMIYHIGTEINRKFIPAIDWENEDLSKLLAEQITENRAALASIGRTL